MRAVCDIAPGDKVVFAKYDPADAPCRYAFDDSNQPDDPAAKEGRNVLTWWDIVGFIWAGFLFSAEGVMFYAMFALSYNWWLPKWFDGDGV